MVLSNKLNITSQLQLAQADEKLSKKKPNNSLTPATSPKLNVAPMQAWH